MADAELRALERLARAGDPDAARRLTVLMLRQGIDPLAHPLTAKRHAEAIHRELVRETDATPLARRDGRRRVVRYPTPLGRFGFRRARRFWRPRTFVPWLEAELPRVRALVERLEARVARGRKDQDLLYALQEARQRRSVLTRELELFRQDPEASDMRREGPECGSEVYRATLQSVDEYDARRFRRGDDDDRRVKPVGEPVERFEATRAAERTLSRVLRLGRDGFSIRQEVERTGLAGDDDIEPTADRTILVHVSFVSRRGAPLPSQDLLEELASP